MQLFSAISGIFASFRRNPQVPNKLSFTHLPCPASVSSGPDRRQSIRQICHGETNWAVAILGILVDIRRYHCIIVQYIIRIRRTIIKRRKGFGSYRKGTCGHRSDLIGHLTGSFRIKDHNLPHFAIKVKCAKKPFKSPKIQNTY